LEVKTGRWMGAGGVVIDVEPPGGQLEVLIGLIGLLTFVSQKGTELWLDAKADRWMDASVVVIGAGPTDGAPGGLVGLVVLAERVHDGVSGMEIKGTYYQKRLF